MNTLKKTLKFLFITILLGLGFYLFEIIVYPKQEINIPMNNYDSIKFLDVNHKLRANKLAGSKEQEPGGWYVSDNLALDINGKFKTSDLELLISDTIILMEDGKYLGNELYLINNGKTNLCLSAQDSRLYLKMQAKNPLNGWNDIEYIPNSWCGNSYHELCLENGKYWKFESPIFSGRHSTTLRYILIYDEQELVSNEIIGFINFGQFINKKKYFPSSIMDTYSE